MHGVHRGINICLKLWGKRVFTVKVTFPLAFKQFHKRERLFFFKGLNKNRYSDEPQVIPFPAKKETLFI